MGAVNQVVADALKTELKTARAKAENVSEATRRNLEAAIDSAVADVIKNSNLQLDITTAIRQVLDAFNQRIP